MVPLDWPIRLIYGFIFACSHFWNYEKLFSFNFEGDITRGRTVTTFTFRGELTINGLEFQMVDSKYCVEKKDEKGSSENQFGIRCQQFPLFLRIFKQRSALRLTISMNNIRQAQIVLKHSNIKMKPVFLVVLLTLKEVAPI